MKNLNKYILGATISVMTCFGVVAQTAHTGYFMDKMPLRHELNPAFAPEFNYVTMPVVGDLNLGMNANIGLDNFLFNRNGETVTGLHKDVSANDFLGGLKDRNYMEANVNMNILSAGFKAWGGYNTISIGVRSNTSIDVPKSMFEFAKVGQTDFGATEYDIQNLNIKTQNYAEIAFGHSHRINNKWCIGGTFKYLMGIANVDLSVDDMNVYMSDTKWRVRDTGRMFYTNAADITYKADGQIDNVEFGSVGVCGHGVGIDFGATFAVLPQLTLSASVTDLGFISWKGKDAVIDESEFEFDGFHHLAAEKAPNGDSALKQEGEQLEEDLKELIRFNQVADKNSTQSLSTTLNFAAEYKMLNNKISIGLLSSTRIANKTWSEAMLSVNFRPATWFHATINGSVSNLGNSVGAMLHFCPKGFNFFVGSDYIPFKYSKDGIPLSAAKINVVMGLAFTFNHGK